MVTDEYWYAVEDDYIQSWAIANVPASISQLRFVDGEHEIAGLMVKEVAEHIVAMHNWYLQDRIWETYRDNLWASDNRDAFQILDMMRMSE